LVYWLGKREAGSAIIKALCASIAFGRMMRCPTLKSVAAVRCAAGDADQSPDYRVRTDTRTSGLDDAANVRRLSFLKAFTSTTPSQKGNVTREFKPNSSQFTPKKDIRTPSQRMPLQRLRKGRLGVHVAFSPRLA
jgi:hypothetical protein